MKRLRGPMHAFESPCKRSSRCGRAVTAFSFLWLCGHIFRRLPGSLCRRACELLRDLRCYQVQGNRQRLLYVGGRPGSADAIMVYLRTASSAAVESMRSARSDSAVIKYGKAIYVFGGIAFRQPLAACEAFDTSTEKWKAIPDMPRPPAYNFTACQYCHDIYLPVCDQSSTVTVFTPHTGEFRELAVSMPMQKGNSVAVVTAGVLVIVNSARCVGKWRIAGKNEFEVKGLGLDIVTDFTIFSCPIAVGAKIYWMRLSYFIKTDLDVVPVPDDGNEYAWN